MANTPDMENYFKIDEKNNCVFFTGEKLLCYIPKKYEKRNYLIIEDKIRALGIFDIEIDGKIEAGICIPAVITIDPVDIYETTKNDVRYLVCELHKGSQFVCNMEVLVDSDIPYYIWTEFLSLGNAPEFMTYDIFTSLFDNTAYYCGKGLQANHAIYEVVVSYIHRDADDINKFYRHTNMNKPPLLVNIRDIAHSTTTTHSRIVGSFGDAGRTSALLHQSEENHPLEDLYRM